MKNVIVDYKKLTPDVLSMLVECYPDGYGDDDIISFRNHKNELIEAVEVTTEDTKYLVKISKRLSMQMEAFDEDDYDAGEMNDPDALPEMDPNLPQDMDDSKNKD